ncbi:O-fucosyltransferase 6-like protein [Tanacetum coccineum]
MGGSGPLSSPRLTSKDGQLRSTSIGIPIVSSTSSGIYATVPKLNLDSAFEQKNEIAKAIEAELKKILNQACQQTINEADKDFKKMNDRMKETRDAMQKRNLDRERRQGRCPLTPKEVVLMQQALRYSSDVHICVASGEVYGGEDTLAPLKALFPNIHSKDTIATKEEMTHFLSYFARMAALDFIVCDESDVFVTNNNGNMAKMLAGRRRYFGHKPTIRPNANKLWRLFVDRNNMTWEEFATTT